MTTEVTLTRTSTPLPATLLAAAAAAALALAVPRAAAQEAKRGPSTPAERKRVVEITHRLEKDPSARNASTDRVWLMKWIDEVPDVTIRYCPGPLFDAEEGEPVDRALWVQSLFGMASFAIEKPADARDWVKAQVAGLESALLAYQAAVKTNPAARLPAFERLLAAQKAGKLAEVVKQEMPACDPAYQAPEPIPEDAI
jgi:hypothetical protein